jgi:xanthine/uracil permease
MTAGVLLVSAYVIYALGEHSPAPDDLKSWAIAMLILIGIGVAAVIGIQIIFHIALAIGIAIKEREHSDEEIERNLSSMTIEDERDKLISLKASHISVIFAGFGFVAALVGLAFGVSAVFALHVIFGACVIGSAAEGIATICFYEKGVRNG